MDSLLRGVVADVLVCLGSTGFSLDFRHSPASGSRSLSWSLIALRVIRPQQRPTFPPETTQ